IFSIEPFATRQCADGTESYPRPRQPLSVLPSNSSRHPAARSAADRVFGAVWAAIGCARASTRRTQVRRIQRRYDCAAHEQAAVSGEGCPPFRGASLTAQRRDTEGTESAEDSRQRASVATSRDVFVKAAQDASSGQVDVSALSGFRSGCPQKSGSL